MSGDGADDYDRFSYGVSDYMVMVMVMVVEVVIVVALVVVVAVVMVGIRLVSPNGSRDWALREFLGKQQLPACLDMFCARVRLCACMR